MLISKLFEDVKCKIIGQDKDINNIQYDSRKIEQNNIFVCVVGQIVDGHDFAFQAIERGAVALVVEKELNVSKDITQVVVENSREIMAVISTKFYDYPAKKLKIVGITGTNGKTTTTYMLKSIADCANVKSGLIGTIKNLIGTEKIKTDKTTPESLDIQVLLKKMVEKDVKMCFMEVSSHALNLNRTDCIDFDVAAFTNLTQDHLDFHKTFDNYRQSKRKLFNQANSAVINIDDHVGYEIYNELSYDKISFGITKDAFVTARDIEITSEGVQFILCIKGLEQTTINLKIPGLFSVFNALTAAGCAFKLGFNLNEIKQGLEAIANVPGRLEKIPAPNQDYSILLDFAHSPDGLENILKTIKGFAKGRIITLFGCGGNRDNAKRPIMGDIAGKYSDFCILTSDNPRYENPLNIIKQIEEGTKKSGCDYTIIENRREAMKYALEIAKQNDTIVLAGRGHEEYQEIMGISKKFSDRDTILKLLQEIEESLAI